MYIIKISYYRHAVLCGLCRPNRPALSPQQWLCSPNSQPPNRTCPNRPSADFPIAARLPVPTLLFPPSLYLPNKRVVPAGGISSISKRTPCGVLPLAPRTSNKPKNKKNPNSPNLNAKPQCHAMHIHTMPPVCTRVRRLGGSRKGRKEAARSLSMRMRGK